MSSENLKFLSSIAEEQLGQYSLMLESVFKQEMVDNGLSLWGGGGARGGPMELRGGV